MTKRGCQLCLAFVLVVGFFSGIIWKTGIYFETNDDRMIAEILSGSLTGRQEYTPYYVNLLFSAPIVWLYHITQQIQWYGLILIVLHLAALWVICFSVLKSCKEAVSIISGAAMLTGLLLMDVYMLGMLQYTSTAALLAIAGYVYLILHKQYKQGMLGFLILEMISYLLRDKAMLMIQPLGAVVFLTCLILSKEDTFSCKRKKVGMWTAAVLLIFFIGAVGNKIGYSGEQWRNYKQFNQARTEMFDYYGTPEYEEVKEILDRYGVSETEYTAFRHYIMVDSPITAECASQLAEYQKAKMARKPSWDMVYEALADFWATDGYMKLNRFAIVLTAVAAVGLLLLQWKLLVPVVCLCASQLVITAYLAYRGRCPNRITFPLFLAQIIFLIAICAKIQDTQTKRRTALRLTFSVALSVLCLVGGYQTGILQYHTVCETNRGQGAYIAGREDVKEYCLQNPQNRYVLDAMSFCYYRGSAYETGIYGKQNSIYSGSWYSKSPAMTAYEEQYLSEKGQGVYVIVYDDGEVLEQQAKRPAAAYFAEKTGTEPKLADRFTVSHGGGYLVWYFGEEQE